MAEGPVSEIIRSTSNAIRALVIIVLLGVIVGVIVIFSVLAIKGRGFQIWQVKVEEYRPPQVQTCAILVAALDKAGTHNSDIAGHLNARIMQLTATISANQTRA